MKIFTIIIFFQLSLFAQSEPSYKIWSAIKTQNINKGDTIVFDVGLSGNGFINPKYFKFCLYSDATSRIFLRDITKPSEIITFNFTDLIGSLFVSENSVIIPADSTRITVGSHFLSVPNSSGNKTIKVIATYSSDGKSWHTEEAFINFHVNTWYEEWETPLVIFGSIFALLGFIAAIISILDFYLKMKFQPFQKQKTPDIVRKKKK